MALFNYATKEITLKIVYYGPGLSGKTTNLQYLHSILNPESKGKLLSLSTEADRTLFFDFMPIEVGKIRDFSIRIQLYTVPGQVRYNATRRVVLKGADAVVFVADSQREMREQNIESLENMFDNLHSNNINPDDIVIFLQYNKRDLKNILSIDELNSDLNAKNYYFTEASAIDGAGVEETYKLITKLLLKNISKKHKIEIQPPQEKEEVKQPEKFIETPVITSESTEVIPEASVFESIGLEYSEKIEEEEAVQEQEIGGMKEVSTEENAYQLEEEIPVEVTDEDVMAEETAGQAVVEEIRELPSIPSERIDMIINRLEKITGILSDIRDSFHILNNSISVLNKGMEEIGEFRKEQEESKTLLQNINNTFDSLKAKKDWFNL